MNTMIISALCILLYLSTSWLLGLRVARGSEASAEPKLGLIALGFGALILHASISYNAIVLSNGLDLSLFNAASLITLIATLMFLLTVIRTPIEPLGIMILPCSALTIALATWFPSQTALIVTGEWQLKLHIITSLIAYSLFCLAAVQAGLLAIQEKRLHARHPGGFLRALPPLQSMETLLFEIIWVGFVLLTIGLLTGFFFLSDMFAQHIVHKTFLSICAWLIFGTLLWGRATHGWRGRTATRWTLSGFVALLLAYLGSKLVLELIIA
ncbi:MAG TPA: cytochrome C biogenesis protein [Chromatiaceae bacterium]|jgi:ABC-type uncharacterized transport system permease subunit|nr:cytochrome C biogenesis protein [Chromatiaceae bacterium]HIA08472.1 cytochrome C biogenesis protein [Chromatiaceae bacterium]HIN82036.1 cytochrome C biogenesis protein [Chromatiales bacterium]HIO55318.1 cytochrome C biogenesis protein [Chromatiales bacterium]